jgi:hypothetical protein
MPQLGLLVYYHSNHRHTGLTRGRVFYNDHIGLPDHVTGDNIAYGGTIVMISTVISPGQLLIVTPIN